MLELMLSLALGLQSPAPASSGGGTPDAVAVEGTVELTRAEAEAAALRAAREHARARLRHAGREVSGRKKPFWLPAAVAERAVEDWLDAAAAGDPEVLSLQTSTHDYSYGTAYRTTVRMRAPAAGPREVSRLERGLREAGRLFVAKCGAVAVAWGLLAFLYSWFDRLTRGYMTWRLRLITTGLAAVVATAAFVSC